MKKLRSTAAALIGVSLAMASMPALAENDSGGSGRTTLKAQATDAKIAAKKAAVAAGRMAAGAAIGGTAGRVITGSPLGAALGTMTPSRIQCQALRGC